MKVPTPDTLRVMNASHDVDLAIVGRTSRQIVNEAAAILQIAPIDVIQVYSPDRQDEIINLAEKLTTEGVCQ